MGRSLTKDISIQVEFQKLSFSSLHHLSMLKRVFLFLRVNPRQAVLLLATPPWLVHQECIQVSVTMMARTKGMFAILFRTRLDQMWEETLRKTDTSRWLSNCTKLQEMGLVSAL